MIKGHCLDESKIKGYAFVIEGIVYAFSKDGKKFAQNLQRMSLKDGNYLEPHLAPYEVRSAKVKLADVPFRLGAQYCFWHGNDCLHSFSIEDIRLINQQDVQSKAAYPLITFESVEKFQFCSICEKRPSAFMTRGDKLSFNLGQTNTFYCVECFQGFHRGKDGKPCPGLETVDSEVYNRD